MPPGSRYAISSSELIAALNDATVKIIVLQAGIYEFEKRGTCSDTNLGDSALCINRAVTIEAEVAGSVVLDAKGTKRVITVLSGAAVKLVGLNITGGAAVPGPAYIRLGLFWRDTISDLSLQGGGLLVKQNGKADLEDCNIFDNTAKEVCAQPLSLFSGGIT